MLVRSAIAAAFVLLAAPVFAAPVLAQSIDPARVLAARGERVQDRAHATAGRAHRADATSSRGFADRTARITAIMGTDLGSTAPLHLPTKPVWVRPVRREADATAGLR